MAKGQTQAATDMSKGLSKTSTAQTQSGLFGGPGGAFGGGLTPQYATQAGEQQQSRGMAFQAASDVAKTGGYDPTTLATVKDFEQTGGISSADKSRYLRQATSGVADTYKNLMQQQQQQRAATGGVGGPSSISQMARQMGQVESRTQTKALDDLQTQIREGRVAGMGAGLEVGKGMRSGAEIMQSMYNADTGAMTQTGKMILDLLGIDSTNQQASMNAMTTLSRNPGTLKTILDTIAELLPG